jgi:hypothetical protein
MRVFEKRELRRIFGPKRDKIIEDRRKLHNALIHKWYLLSNRIIK